MKTTVTAIAFLLLLSVQACSNGSAASKPEGDESQAMSSPESPIGTSSTIHINRAQFLAKVIDFTKGEANMKYLGDKPCIVDFYADWCGPCRTVAPILEELAKEYAGRIYIYKVDTQKERQLSQELGIQGIPAFFFFPLNDKPFASSGIARTKEETKKMFKQIIDEQLLKTPN